MRSSSQARSATQSTGLTPSGACSLGKQGIAQRDMRPARRDRRVHAAHQGRQEGTAGAAPRIVGEPRVAPGRAAPTVHGSRRAQPGYSTGGGGGPRCEAGDLFDRALVGAARLMRAACVGGWAAFASHRCRVRRASQAPAGAARPAGLAPAAPGSCRRRRHQMSLMRIARRRDCDLDRLGRPLLGQGRQEEESRR